MKIQLIQTVHHLEICSVKKLKRRASHLSLTMLSLLLFPALFYPAKAQKINNDELNLVEMPVGHYTKELRAIDQQQLLEIVEDFKAASIDPNQSTSLSLDECISFAFANNPSLKAQIELLKSTRDRFIAQSRSWNPTASITGRSNASNENDSKNAHNETLNSREITRTYTTSSSNSYPRSIRGELSWKFLDFSRQPTIDAAVSAYSAQRYSFYNFSRQLVFQIQETYYQLLAQQELIKSFEIVAESLKSTVLYTDSHFEAGRIHLGDLGQAHAQYYSTLSNLTEYIQRYYQLSNQLAKLVSLPGEPLIFAEGENQFVGEWIFGLEKSIDLAQLNNDRVLESLELAKRYNSEGIAQLNRTLPSFSLTSEANLSNTPSDSYNFSNTSTSGSSNASNNGSVSSKRFSFTSGTRYGISAGIGFNWNFYQGGVNNANASDLFSRSKSEEFKVENIRDQLIENVRASINSLRSNRIRFKTSDAAAESAKISYIASIARMNAGFSDVTTINQLVRLYQSSIQAEIRAIQDYNIRLAILYRDTAIWPQEAEGLAVELLEATGLPR